MLDYDEIKALIGDIRMITDRYRILEEQFKDVEDLHCDLEHEIEFSNYDIQRGYKAYKQFRDMRIERRKLKDEIELLEPIATYINENRKIFLDGLGRVKGECKKINDRQKNRLYRPRILTDMSERLPKVDFIIGG
jgi:hypothetical protein